MSDSLAIHLSNVGKMYKIFPSRKDYFIDGLNDTFGVCNFLPIRRPKYNEFWALKDINIDLKEKSQLGVIGRNGAGKSTLLKLITGNIKPSEGKIKVNGKIQALLESGAGFHPEFSGYENIKISLTYQGLSPKEIDNAIVDISDFSELGEFLKQPFKTYSLGMQARLTFATATAIKPTILIIDEILGAGDAYFFGKSIERMHKLVKDSGASVIIVSHALDQITRFCEESVWIERGKIVKRGKTHEIVDSYVAFTQKLEERRITAKNKRNNPNKSLFNIYSESESIVVDIIVQGKKENKLDIHKIELLSDGLKEDLLNVGDAQDTNSFQNSYIILEGSTWSSPKKDSSMTWRSININENKKGSGKIVFSSYGFFNNSYEIKIHYRGKDNILLKIEIFKNDEKIVTSDKDLLKTNEWETFCISFFCSNQEYNVDNIFFISF
jgi:lipopolysaccharide transport system ATP-binding protein